VFYCQTKLGIGRTSKVKKPTIAVAIQPLFLYGPFAFTAKSCCNFTETEIRNARQ